MGKTTTHLRRVISQVLNFIVIFTIYLFFTCISKYTFEHRIRSGSWNVISFLNSVVWLFVVFFNVILYDFDFNDFSFYQSFGWHRIHLMRLPDLVSLTTHFVSFFSLFVFIMFLKLFIWRYERVCFRFAYRNDFWCVWIWMRASSQVLAVI